MAENVRAHLIITGIVQGVFFRMETQRAANQYGVNGWVRNKRDGSVEAVVEGPKENVESLIEWCRQGPPRATVNDVDIGWEEYRGEFSEFRVSH
jgi:acylphosphatase